MTRIGLSLASCLLVLSTSSPARACPVDPFAEAFADAGLSSISTPLEVQLYGDPDAARCRARLLLDVSMLASRSLVPRPRELAEGLVPVARAYGAQSCAIFVEEFDGMAEGAARSGECRTVEFRYADGAWWPAGDEEPCD